jgi:hypothetical protein
MSLIIASTFLQDGHTFLLGAMGASSLSPFHVHLRWVCDLLRLTTFLHLNNCQIEE